MSVWYRALDRLAGGGACTHILLAKCALDQLLFATQGDVLFPALAAYQGAEDVSDAACEVCCTFVTTWINDCAVWPLVNSVGFAAPPTALLPTHMAAMAAMQLGWQVRAAPRAHARAVRAAQACAPLATDCACVRAASCTCSTRRCRRSQMPHRLGYCARAASWRSAPPARRARP